MCFVRDLKTHHGTYVNGVRILEELLYNGDKIKIGTVCFAFEELSGEESEESPPPKKFSTQKKKTT